MNFKKRKRNISNDKRKSEKNNFKYNTLEKKYENKGMDY